MISVAAIGGTICNASFLWFLLQPLEALWQLLADWLCLLKLEFNKDNNQNNKDNNKDNKSDSHNQDSKEHTQSHEQTQENSDTRDTASAIAGRDCNQQMDPRSCDQEGILKSLCVDQDVVGVILPRICGVVHAFYICCTCQHGHPQLVQNYQKIFILSLWNWYFLINHLHVI